MDIDQAIKQKNFDSNQEKVVINLLYTSNWIRDSHAEIFKPYKILGQHYNVLRIVNGQDPRPVSPGYILEVMLDKKRDLTRLVDKLVSIGYLSRKTCEDNRRKVDISITEKGKKVVELTKQEIYNWLNNNQQLTEDESMQLSRLLDKMRS